MTRLELKGFNIEGTNLSQPQVSWPPQEPVVSSVKLPVYSI